MQKTKSAILTKLGAGNLPAGKNSVKAKFVYSIQVADLAFDKFVLVCEQLATFLGRKQVADKFEISRHVEITQTCLRQVGQ